MKCDASIRKKYEIIRGDARKLIICEEKLRKTSVLLMKIEGQWFWPPYVVWIDRLGLFRF